MNREAPPVRPRTHGNISQVTRHSQELRGALESRPAVECVPGRTQALSEPRVGVPAVQRHDQRRARLARGPHGRQRPGGLMLVDNVRPPGRDGAAHRTQTSRLGYQTLRKDGRQSPRRSHGYGERDRRIVNPRRQSECSPIAFRHSARVREREIRRGNQQRSLRQSDLHGICPRMQRRSRGGGHAPILRARVGDLVIK